MKRHTNQNSKQKHGQFFTTNASQLLEGFEDDVKGKCVIDPFAGNKDLIDWAMSHGAVNCKGFDIFPVHKDIIKNDSLMEPPDYTDLFLISNPPYLSKNKNKNKEVYDKWKESDYYKCHMASFFPTLKEGILILPSNFLSESHHSTRTKFFRNYGIRKAKYFYYQVFPNATTGTTVFSFHLDQCSIKNFPMEVHYKDRIEKIDVELSDKYDYLYGEEFFDFIFSDNEPLKVTKYDETSTSLPNTNIIISLLSFGKLPLGAHYNHGEPFKASAKTFTTYQVSINCILSEKQQLELVELYNEKLQYFIKKYHGLFLSNFMGAEQKIKSRKYSNLLLSKIIKTMSIS